MEGVIDKMPQTFLDNLAKKLFGKTKTRAVKSGKCIRCGEPALENCYSEMGRREFNISGLCEKCFDSMFGEE